MRAGLAAFKNGPVLELTYEKGTRRADLVTDKDRTALGLGDEKGTERAELKATKDGPGLALSDKDGKPIGERLEWGRSMWMADFPGRELPKPGGI